MFRRTLLAMTMICTCGAAAGGLYQPGPRAAALGGLATALAGDAWAPDVNPALTWTLRGISAAVDLTPAPFGLPELARAGAALRFSFGSGAAGLSASRMGDGMYCEIVLVPGAAVPVGTAGSVGAAMTVRTVRIRGYGTATALSASVGACFVPLEGVQTAFAVSDIASTPLGRSGERAERTVQWGLLVRVRAGLSAGAEIWKTARFPAEIHAGLEYAPLEGLLLRAGVSQEPATLTAGAGVTAGPVLFDYAAVFHPVLGSTHLLGLTLCIAGE